MTTVPSADLMFREGRPADLSATYALAEQATADAARRQGVNPGGADPEPDGFEDRWSLDRPLVEFIAAQEGCYWLCEEKGELVGFARLANFGSMEELTELMVEPRPLRARHRARRCWSGAGPGRRPRPRRAWWWPPARPPTSACTPTSACCR